MRDDGVPDGARPTARVLVLDSSHRLLLLEVRGITDVANADGPRDFAANLAMAMQNVAVVVNRIASL